MQLNVTREFPDVGNVHHIARETGFDGVLSISEIMSTGFGYGKTPLFQALSIIHDLTGISFVVTGEYRRSAIMVDLPNNYIGIHCYALPQYREDRYEDSRIGSNNFWGYEIDFDQRYALQFPRRTRQTWHIKDSSKQRVAVYMPRSRNLFIPFNLAAGKDNVSEIMFHILNAVFEKYGSRLGISSPLKFSEFNTRNIVNGLTQTVTSELEYEVRRNQERLDGLENDVLRHLKRIEDINMSMTATEIDLEVSKKKLDQFDPQKITDNLLALSQRYGEDNVRMTGDFISINMGYRYIQTSIGEKYSLGEITARISVSGILYFMRTGPINNNAYPRHYVHPNCDIHGKPIFDEASVIIGENIANWEFSLLMDILENYISQYNQDSEYLAITEWPLAE